MPTGLLPRKLANGAVFVASLVVGVWLLTGVSWAAGLTVFPAKADITIPKGAAKATATITVKNDFATDITLRPELYGINATQGSIVPSGPLTGALADSIQIIPSELTINPGKAATITIQITDNGKIAPGGNYAALIVRQAQTSEQQAIGLRAAVSVGLFITKETGAIRSLKVDPPTLPKIAFWMPSTTTVAFKNEGNVILVPRGSLRILANDTVVSKTVLNDGSISVLPGNQVRLEQKFTGLSDAWLPTTFTSSLHYRYDGSSQDIGSNTSNFLYIPLKSMLLVLITIGLLLYPWKQYRALYRHATRVRLKKAAFFGKHKQ
jgi:hypothetical protein